MSQLTDSREEVRVRECVPESERERAREKGERIRMRERRGREIEWGRGGERTTVGIRRQLEINLADSICEKHLSPSLTSKRERQSGRRREGGWERERNNKDIAALSVSSLFSLFLFHRFCSCWKESDNLAVYGALKTVPLEVQYVYLITVVQFNLWRV